MIEVIVDYDVDPDDIPFVSQYIPFVNGYISTIVSRVLEEDKRSSISFTSGRMVRVDIPTHIVLISAKRLADEIINATVYMIWKDKGHTKSVWPSKF